MLQACNYLTYGGRKKLISSLLASSAKNRNLLQIPIEDDGSVASRGNVLLRAYELTANATILTHVKLYHYGCVYNNWYNYAEDDICFQ